MSNNLNKLFNQNMKGIIGKHKDKRNSSIKAPIKTQSKSSFNLSFRNESKKLSSQKLLLMNEDIKGEEIICIHCENIMIENE